MRCTTLCRYVDPVPGHGGRGDQLQAGRLLLGPGELRDGLMVGKLVPAGALQRGEGRADRPGEAALHRVRREALAERGQTEGGDPAGPGQRARPLLCK